MTNELRTILTGLEDLYLSYDDSIELLDELQMVQNKARELKKSVRHSLKVGHVLQGTHTIRGKTSCPR